MACALSIRSSDSRASCRGLFLFEDWGLGVRARLREEPIAMTTDPKPRPELPRPLVGAYYWLPRPAELSCHWDLVTCHCLGLGSDEGHTELWPAVVRQMAMFWRRDAEALFRRLGEHYAGLPRGRVTRVRGVYLIHHGGDTPGKGGLGEVEIQFGLGGRRVRHVKDDHERMLAGDPEVVQGVLDADLGLRGV